MMNRRSTLENLANRLFESSGGEGKEFQSAVLTHTVVANSILHRQENVERKESICDLCTCSSVLFLRLYAIMFCLHSCTFKNVSCRP